MTEPRPVMLAAGGTGGHLFPAFALAEELGRRGLAVELVTDQRGDRYGADFPARRTYRLPAATLTGRSPVAAARTAVTLTRAVSAALRLIKAAKPMAVIGFGGYPTLAPLIAARMRRVPSALHEQNAVLGRANALLAKRVSAVATSFATVRGLDRVPAAKVRLTGNPVRQTVLDWSAREFTSPDAGGPFNLVVFGGSQGARFFSDALPPALALLPDAVRANLFIVQQCREEDLARVDAAYERMGVHANLAPFFANLPEEMARAHLVIGRAGASTIAELTALGRPSILVPLPHAVDNDQLLNAKQLAAAGGALAIEQKDLSPERLAVEIARLLTENDVLPAMAEAARTQGRPDAVIRLADLVETLAGRNSASR